MQRRAMLERVDAARLGLGIAVNDQLHPGFRREPVPQRVELGELPAGVDVQERERRPRREEGFPREVQHDHAVLAAGEEHDRPLRLGHRLADDVDRLRFQSVEMVGPRHESVVQVLAVTGQPGKMRPAAGRGTMPVLACFSLPEQIFISNPFRGRSVMRMFRALAVLASVTLASSPVLAQSAAPLSLAPTVAADSSELDGGFGIPAVPAIVLAGIVIGAIFLAVHDDDHPPVSP